MEQQRLLHYRRLLEAELDEIRARLAHLEDAEVIGSLKDSLQELSMYDNHPADIATETFERSKDIGLRDLSKVQITKIRKALKKIEDGSYGRCGHCGKEISEERLDAVPATILCYECQRVEHDRIKSSRRPVEEGVVMPPFGGFAENRLDSQQAVEFDGEDAWQAVERYGTSSDVVHGELGVPHREMGEDRGIVEDVESVPYYRGEDGVLYRDFQGKDDESGPVGPI